MLKYRNLLEVSNSFQWTENLRSKRFSVTVSPTCLFATLSRLLDYFLSDKQILRDLTVFSTKRSGGGPSALFIRTEMKSCLAEANTDQPIFHHVMTIDIEGHSFVICTGRCCSEVWCYSVIAPAVTMLETDLVTRNKKPRVEMKITNQQLIGVVLVYSLSVP